MERIDDVSERHVQRRDVDWSEEAGRVVIRRAKRGAVRRRLLKLFGISPVLTLRLDPLGSEVWKALDGGTVASVLAKLRDAHPEEEELAARLGRYLGLLASNELIDLV